MAEHWSEPSPALGAQYKVTTEGGRWTVGYASSLGVWRTRTFDTGLEAGAFTERLAEGRYPVAELVEDAKAFLRVYRPESLAEHEQEGN